jgi:hypothetical protein
LLENKVWERGFEYGFGETLKKLAPESIEKFSIIVTELPHGAFGAVSAEMIVADTCGSIPDQEILAAVNTSWSRNFLVVQADFSFDCTLPDAELGYLSLQFVEIYNRLVALAEEMGALFRAAVYLTFYCDYPIIPGFDANIQSGGLVFLKSSSGSTFHSRATAAFTYPAVFLADAIDDFRQVLDRLAGVWHFPLWPIHRYLRALNAEYIEMENLLDLLFSFEGLFHKNASTDFMKTSAALLVGQNAAEAQQIIELLGEAYKIRNEIVHGSYHYTGLENIKIQGREVLSQRIFPEIRRIVGHLVWVAVGNLSHNEGMRALRIKSSDLIDRYFATSVRPRSTASRS